MMSHQTNGSDEVIGVMRKKQICLVGDVVKDPLVQKAVQTFGLPVVTSETGEEYLNISKEHNTVKTIFVLNDFDGSSIEKFRKSEHRVFGAPAVLLYAERSVPLPRALCPVHDLILENKIVCFSGYRMKEEVSFLNTLVHNMGGKTRKDMSVKVNYLIAAVPFGEKYQSAANVNIPVVSKEWLNHLWSLRFERNVNPDDHIEAFQYKPFAGRKLAFWGYSEQLRIQKEEEAKANGAVIASVDNASCTHIVVNEENGGGLEAVDVPSDVHVVKESWFAASLHLKACAEESLYRFWENDFRTPPNLTKLSSISRTRSSHSRKRPRDAPPPDYNSTHEDTPDYYPNSDRKPSLTPHEDSSSSFCKFYKDFSPLSFISPSPMKHRVPRSIGSTRKLPLEEHVDWSPSLSKLNIKLETMTSRQQVVYELLQTEFNYVDILKLLVNDFMRQAEQLVHGDDKMRIGSRPMEEENKKRGVGQTEIKIIFGNLPPILAIHLRLRNQLFHLLENWSDTCSVGKVFLDNAEELLKVYPPFVNFFEETKQMIRHCEAEYPEFQTFLKQCQEHPKSGRQSLSELIIRPVQRLPSISLLLNDILKRTDLNNPDHEALENALQTLKKVLTHINEDKRKVEGQVAMFDIEREIDGCPPTLISSHRKFSMKVHVVILKGEICGKTGGTELTLFLFSDVLEVCKTRSKVLSSQSGAGTSGTLKVGANGIVGGSGIYQSHLKPYKHLEMVSLVHVKKIIDITETEFCSKAFGLVMRAQNEVKERELILALIGEESSKEKFLKSLCRHMVNVQCRPDTENLFISVDPEKLNIDTKDVVTKAWNTAVRMCSKIGRNLTMRKGTPSKRNLIRTASTIISPMVVDKKDEEGQDQLETGTPRPQSPKILPLLTKVKSASLGPGFKHT